MVSDWAQLDELRLACRASEPNYRRHHALSALLACSRAEMVAALLAQRSRTTTTPAGEDCSLAALVLSGALRHEALSSLLHGGLASLLLHWHAQPSFVADAVARLGSTIAPPAVFGSASLPPVPPDLASAPSITCPLSTLLFGAVIAACWPWRLALRLFAGLGRGSPCTGGRSFIPDRGKGIHTGIFRRFTGIFRKIPKLSAKPINVH